MFVRFLFLFASYLLVVSTLYQMAAMYTQPCAPCSIVVVITVVVVVVVVVVVYLF